VSDIDPDAQEFFDRVTTAGGTLSATEKTAINTLVKQMKLDGIWTKMKAIYPMVGASAAACAQNLKSSSFTGAFSAGWTFASTGVTPNGTSAEMTTSLVFPSAEKNDASLGVYQNTNILTYSGCAIGNLGATGPMSLFISSGGSLYGYINDNQNVLFANSTELGFYHIERISSSQVNFFKNGADLGTNPKSSTVSATIETTPIKLANGGFAPQYSKNRIAFAFIGNSLTSSLQNNFYTAVQAFQTTLSRQV
jgi:hypothetical protein